MDLFLPDRSEPELSAPLPCVASFRPILWEPLSGTGERLVALIAVEPHSKSSQPVVAATHCVLAPEKLRLLLGRQRGNAAIGVLRSAAAFMSSQQQRGGLALSALETPFHGLELGPVMVARGYSVSQLLNTAVRTVSSLGSPDDLVETDDDMESPRHTLRTVEFLRSLRREIASDDPELKRRFNQRIAWAEGLDMTVDYAFGRWFLQITSLPSSRRQALHTQKEAQSKLFELEQIRKHFKGVPFQPVVLVNDDVLIEDPSAESIEQANRMLERVGKLARDLDVQVMRASTPLEGARLIVGLR